jgi:hypothetical protein
MSLKYASTPTPIPTLALFRSVFVTSMCVSFYRTKIPPLLLFTANIFKTSLSSLPFPPSPSLLSLSLLSLFSLSLSLSLSLYHRGGREKDGHLVCRDPSHNVAFVVAVGVCFAKWQQPLRRPPHGAAIRGARNWERIYSQ